MFFFSLVFFFLVHLHLYCYEWFLFSALFYAIIAHLLTDLPYGLMSIWVSVIWYDVKNWVVLMKFCFIFLRAQTFHCNEWIKQSRTNLWKSILVNCTCNSKHSLKCQNFIFEILNSWVPFEESEAILNL